MGDFSIFPRDSEEKRITLRDLMEVGAFFRCQLKVLTGWDL